MPKFMELFGYQIFFWSNEGRPTEPLHVHISKNPHANATKVWINEDGSCELESNSDKIPMKDLKRIMKTIEIYSDDIANKWKEYFGEEPTYHNI
jgi:hypothetical protein